MYSLRPIEDGKYGIWLDNDLKVVVYDSDIAIKIVCFLNDQLFLVDEAGLQI